MARSASPSASSTLSCINVSMDASEHPSSTPPTSVTDGGSVSSKNSNKDDESISAGRTKRSRASLVNYNEARLSGTSRNKKAKAGEKSTKITNSHMILDQDARKLVRDSIQVLDLDWTIDQMSQGHDGLQESTGNAIKASSNGKSSLMKKVASAMSRTTSVLGKRSRDTVEKSVSRVQVLGKRASLRVKQQITKVDEAPAEKRPKLVPVPAAGKAETPSQLVRKPVKVPTTKRWLSQGLYVGQDADFDPRMTETKNKIKKDSSKKLPTQQRKILPLPMFAGKRLLETGRPFQLPFDTFNPLPNGQPKPDEWRKVGRNVFIGDAAEIWRDTKLTEVSRCLCTLDNGCDEDCINRTMFYECDESNCNVGIEKCQNRSFEQLRQRVKAGGKYNIGVEVVKTKDKGYGVRANRSFEPHQIIIEYTGEIITPEECDRRMYNEYKDNECFYLMVFDQNMIIDATRGSIARFVNHSCEPNCEMVKWTVASKPRMALFAGPKGVMTGEELTYDYNFDPFSTKNTQECRCGKPSCRGILGRKNKETKESKEPAKPASLKPGTKRKYQDTIEEDPSSGSRKKQRILAAGKSVKKTIAVLKASTKKQVKNMTKQKHGKALAGSAKLGHSKAGKPGRKVKLAATRVVSASSRGSKAVSAATIQRGVVRTVRGKAGGRGRTIRMVAE